MTEHDKSIRQSVLDTIEKKEIKQHSKWYFALRTFTQLLATILAALILLFLVSFTIFTLQYSGRPYQSRSLTDLVFGLPWLIILAAIILFGLLEILVRRYQFVYQRPLLYTLLGLTLLLAGGSVIVARLHVHEQLLLRARMGRLPVGGIIYRRYRMRDYPQDYNYFYQQQVMPIQ